MKTIQMRPAFTLIEILISVLILSGSIVYALKIHSSNHDLILYITERSKFSLQDSLFLSDDASKYHRDKKEAYDVIHSFFKIDDFKSRKILKSISREYYIPEPINLTGEEADAPTAIIEEIKIKDKFSSSYFHFKINAF